MHALRNGESTQRSASQSNAEIRNRSRTLDSKMSDAEVERAIKSDNDVSQMDQSVGSLGDLGHDDSFHSQDHVQTQPTKDDRHDLEPVITITEPQPEQTDESPPAVEVTQRDPSPSPQVPGAFVPSTPDETTPPPIEKPHPLQTRFASPVGALSPPTETPMSAMIPASPYDIGILDVDDDESSGEEKDEEEDEEERLDESEEVMNPWTSSLPGLSQDEARSTRLARSRTVLSQILQMRTPDTPQTGFLPYEDEDQSADEYTEHGSIQIMLGSSPTQERFSHRNDGFRWNDDDGEYGPPSAGSRGGDEERTPVDRSKPLPRLPISRTQSRMRTGSRSKATSMHSTASSDRHSRASSYHPLDEEAYRRISQVLQEYYRNSRHVTQDMIHEVQQLIITHTPDLARQGQWDPTKVTQLYMAELAKGSYGAPAPDLPPMPPLDTYYAHKEGAANQPNSGESSAGGADDGLLKRPNPTIGPTEWASPRPNLVGPMDWIDASVPSYWNEDKLTSEPSSESATPADEKNTPVPPGDSAVSLGADLAKRMSKTSPAMSQTTLSSSERHSRLELTPTLPQIDIGGDGLGLDLGSPTTPLDGNKDSEGASLSSTRQSSIISLPPDAPGTHGPPAINPRGSSKYTWYRPSSPKSIRQLDQLRHDRPTSEVSSNLQRPSTATTVDPSSTERESLDQATELVPLDPIDSATKVRLDARRKAMMELVNTEKSYLRDMTVVEQIYRATGKDIPRLSKDDLKVIFGNLDEMLTFSKKFLDGLKQAISSVYTIPKSVIGTSRNSVAAQLNGHLPGERSSMVNPDFNENERDQRTTVGGIFGQHLQDLEKIYGEYSKNLALAQQRLVKIQQDESIASWLRECAEAANNLTKAWNLDSLLVKPVQRLFMYNLLLERIMKATPEDHPDYSAMKVATARMVETSNRIDETQQKTATVPAKPAALKKRERGQSDVRHGVGKLLGRGADKFRQPQMFAVRVEDQVYKGLFNKFGEHLCQLQLVLRDIDQYLVDIQLYYDRFAEVARAIEGFLDVGVTPNPAIESKWRKFGIIVRELGSNALLEHVSHGYLKACRSATDMPSTEISCPYEGARTNPEVTEAT